MIFTELAALVVVLCLVGGSFALAYNRLQARDERRRIKLLEGLMREAEVDGDKETVAVLRRTIIKQLDVTSQTR